MIFIAEELKPLLDAEDVIDQPDPESEPLDWLLWFIFNAHKCP
jgi:hypothetical protein